MQSAPDTQANMSSGTLDGVGAGDHDQPYRLGRRPRVVAPYPFSTREYARLLILRSRVTDCLFGADGVRADAP